MLRPKTKRFALFLITPLCASANVLPIVGWPAIGISLNGVKMRIRMSVSGRSFGRMNVLSEKFISRAMACMCAVSSPRASVNTASWLPSSGLAVKTS